MVLNEKINAPRALVGKGKENEKPNGMDTTEIVSDGWGSGGDEAMTALEWTLESSGLSETWFCSKG